MVTVSIILTVAYSTYLTLSTTCQLVVLYFIIFHSTKSLHLFRFLLAYNSVSQLIYAYGTFITRTTFAQLDSSYEIRSYGLARHLTGSACFFVYELAQVASQTSTTAKVITFDLKYLSVSRLFIPRSHIVWKAVLFHMPVLLFIAVQLWVSWEMFVQPIIPVSPQLPDDNEYSVVAYYSKLSIPASLTVPIMYFIALFPVPFSWYKRRGIIRELDRTKTKISASRRADHQQFVMGLLLQAMIPTVVLVLSTVLFYILTTYETDIRMQQLHAISVGFFSSFMDPLITLYSVNPYRKKLKSWMNTQTSDVRSFTTS